LSRVWTAAAFIGERIKSVDGHAEALNATRKNPALRSVVEHEIEEYAAAQAELIKLVPIFVASSSPKRDAFCATHHG